jgi:hypothetical protein
MAKPFKSWTSNKSMSWGFGEPMSRDNPLNQNNFNQNYTMQKTKSIWSKDSGLPQFFLPKFSGKDKRSSVGTQFTLAPPTNPNAVIKNKGNTYEVMQRAQPKGGIQTSTGYIMEDTLFKQNKFGYTGLDTIVGMSEQYITTTNKDGIKTDTLIRGKNYANIDYPSYEYQDMKTKKAKKAAKEARDKLSLLLPHLNPDGSVKSPKEPDESEGSGGASTSHPKAVGETYAVGGTRPGGYGTGKGSRRGKGRGSRRGQRYWNQAQAFKSNPLVHAANSIQSQLGRSQIVDSWRRVGYGNRQEQADYITPSKNIIEDYNKKTTVNTWAKTIDPEHANVFNYTNEGERMDLTYDKVMKKSKEKKTEYKTYYDTHADVQDYNYYAVGDEDLVAFKEHKDYLLGDISYRRSNQKEIIDRLKLDAKTIEQKDRSDSIIPVLESDIDTLDTKSTVIKNN